MKTCLGIAVTVVLAGTGVGLAGPAQAASKKVYTPAECESASRAGYTCDYSYAKDGDVTDYGRDLLASRATQAVAATVAYGPTTGWGHSDNGPGPTTAKGRAASVVSLTNANAQMDCSGLTRYVYGALGADIEYTGGATGSGSWDPGSGNQPDRFVKVSSSAAQKGDLIWWSGHVAIYLGGNTIVESWPGVGVRKVAFHSSGSYLKSNATFYRVKLAYVD